jgi:hypothetical protein
MKQVLVEKFGRPEGAAPPPAAPCAAPVLPSRSTVGRFADVVCGGLLALMALAAIAGGAHGLWLHTSQRYGRVNRCTRLRRLGSCLCCRADLSRRTRASDSHACGRHNRGGNDVDSQHHGSA